MTSPDYASLVERLEKCTGPDRVLDADVMLAIDSAVIGFKHDFCVGWLIWDRHAICSPHYTSSLDAAITLVPAGYFWQVGYSKYVRHDARVAAQVMSGGFVAECDSTRAIALCIASLLARKASSGAK